MSSTANSERKETWWKRRRSQIAANRKWDKSFKVFKCKCSSRASGLVTSFWSMCWQMWRLEACKREINDHRCFWISALAIVISVCQQVHRSTFTHWQQIWVGNWLINGTSGKIWHLMIELTLSISTSTPICLQKWWQKRPVIIYRTSKELVKQTNAFGVKYDTLVWFVMF